MTHREYSIGSKNTLQEDYTRELVGTLASMLCNLGQDSSNYIQYHNIYTAYTTLLLFYATGHRPVIDPFCYYSDFDLVNQQVLIEDKVLTEKHRYRLTALPYTGCRQVEEYVKHLKWLVYRLNHNEHYSLGSAVGMVLDTAIDNNSQILPFLFFINVENDVLKTVSISESSLDLVLEKFWPITFNQSRHNISTSLRDRLFTETHNARGLRVSAIEAHLGHMEQLAHPFGITSTISFEEHKKIIIHHMDELMKNVGWDVMPAKKHAGYKIYPAKMWIHSSLPLGPINREITRKSRRIADVSCVREILEKYEPEDLYRQNILEKIRDEVINASAASTQEINRRLGLLIRFIAKLKKKNSKIKLPNNYIALTAEPSPFDKNTVKNYREYNRVSHGFLQYLANEGRLREQLGDSAIEKSTRIAEIVVSAVLFDSIYDNSIIEYLIEGSIDVIKEQEVCLVDIQYDGCFCYRWMPGMISLSLLNGLVNSKIVAGQMEQIHSADVQSKITNILTKILPNGNAGISQIKYLINISQTYSSVSKPGYLHRLVSNPSSCSHLPQSTVVRILRNECLIDQDFDKADGSHLRLDNIIIPTTRGTYRFSDVEQFIRDLESDLNCAKMLVADRRQDVERLKRNKLISLINERFKKKHHYPPIAVYMASWIKKLCVSGTDLYEPMLKFSVIDEYGRMIAKAVCYLLYDISSLDLDVDEYEYIYEVAVESCAHSDKTKFKNNLADFHNFLVNTGIADPIDWEPINNMVSESKVASRVDANFITVDEYASALKVLDSLANKDKANAEFYYQCAALLLLGYRFGLRVSEGVYLEYGNIQRGAGPVSFVVHVVNNRFKTTKSSAGRRQVPLVGKLSELERDIVERVLVNHERDDASCNIFTDSTKSDSLIDYSLANKTIKQILVHVTGDPNVRFHHLRHSYANRIFSLLFNSDECFRDEFVRLINGYMYVECGDANRLLTGVAVPNSRSLIALTALMGHGNIRTTFSSYVHITDFLLNQSVSSAENKEDAGDNKDTDVIASYCTGAKLNYVSRQRQRKKIKTDELLRTLSLFINEKKFPKSKIRSKKYDDDQIGFIQESTKTPTLLEIDTVITLANPALHLDSNKIASRIYQDSQTVNGILDDYHALIHDSLYDGYFTAGDHGSLTKFTKETQRVRGYIRSHLDEMKKTCESTDATLNSGLRIWAELHHPVEQATGVIISRPEQFFTYIDLLNVLGVSLEHLRIYIPSNITQSNWYEYTGISRRSLIIKDCRDKTKSLTIHNVGISKTIRKSFTKQRYGDDPRLQVVLDAKEKHPLKYQKSLDRLFFLLNLCLLQQK